MGKKKSFAINIALRLVKSNLDHSASFVPAQEVLAFIDEVYKHFAAEYDEDND